MNNDTTNQTQMNETQDLISPTKITNNELDQLEEDDEDLVDSFAERYLDSINDSVKALSPEKIREKVQTIIDEPIKQGMGGLNTTIFSSTTDVVQIMQAKNGVKLVSNKQEVGTGRYINSNPSKMSLSKYNQIAEQNKSLVNISIGGENRDTSMLNATKSVNQGNRLLNAKSGMISDNSNYKFLPVSKSKQQSNSHLMDDDATVRVGENAWDSFEFSPDHDTS